MIKKILAAGTVLAALAGPVLAQSATSPEGVWVDSYGTSFQFSLCGDGTDLCGVLTNIEGRSRTEANLAYVNQQVVSANQTAANQWEGTVIYDGSEAAATVTQVAADQINIQGCRGIFCQTLEFNRVS